MSTTITRSTTANAAYQANRAEVLDKVQRLLATVEAHAGKQAKNPRNWGWVGDLVEVNNQLAEMLSMLGVEA